MQIQLSWTDLESQSPRHPLLETPVAFGREFTLMPGVIEGQRVSRIVLADDRVESYQALITDEQGELIIVNQNSAQPLLVNDVALPSSTLMDGDRIQIGPFLIQITLPDRERSQPFTVNPVTVNPGEPCPRMVGFLFKRRCNRLDPTGCPDCAGGQAGADPYFYDRSWYAGYGNYTYADWSSPYYYNRDCYSYNPDTRRVDFTEADSMAFEREGDFDYEQDLGAS